VDIKFTKMHGAGNDFVLIDNQTAMFPEADTDWIAHIASRRTGIGCDGLVLLSAGSAPGRIAMRFFNPDGSDAALCGNAARCVARYASDRGLTPASMIIETAAGAVPATSHADGATITMPTPRAWCPSLSLPTETLPFDTETRCCSINTGVPHVILLSDDAAAIPAADLVAGCRAIRHAAAFAPAGTNVNLVTVQDRHHALMRTYERGVEAETLACGTGATAVGIAMARRNLMDSPIHLLTQGGDTLTIELPEGATGDHVLMSGPAAYVYSGTINYPPTPVRKSPHA
jgi:diaminopimelate epimerase